MRTCSSGNSIFLRAYSGPLRIRPVNTLPGTKDFLFSPMKRFTETTKWNDPWYRKLTPQLKCFWLWLCDNCDSAGVINVDFELASFQIGELISADDMVSFADRIRQLPKGRFWIIKFIPFQYGKLSRDCKPHTPVFTALERNGLSDYAFYPNGDERVSKGYPKGFQTLEEKEKEKDQDQDQEQDQDRKGVQGETQKDATPMPSSYRTSATPIPPPSHPHPTWTPNEVQRRLNLLFSRRDSTRWSDKELKALKAIGDIPEDELVMVECYYKGPQPPDRDIRRTTLQILLNNWNGEVDRARRYKPSADSGKIATINCTTGKTEYYDPV